MHEIALDGNARPRRRLRAPVLLCAMFACGGAAGGAAAQRAPEGASRAALSVEAPEDCATHASIAERVRERSTRIELAHDASLSLRIALRRAAKGAIAAELSIEWPDGRRSQRELTASSCDEAADAIALLIVLALDPSASASARDASIESAPVDEPAADGSSVAERTAPKVLQPASTQRQASGAESEDTPASPPTEANPLALSHFAIGLAAGGALGIAPRAMPGVALTASVALEGAGLWTPLFQVRLGRMWLATERSAGRAVFELDAVHAVACALGVRSEALAARACLSGTLGRLSARGSETYDPQAHARLYGSAGAELLATLKLVGPLQLEAGAGLGVPLRRDRFAFAPSVFHRVSAVVGHAQLGLAVRFP